MMDPNRHVPSYHDPVSTFENVPDESINLEFEIPDDDHNGANIMLDEDITQLVGDRYHLIGENIMLNENMNQFGTSQTGPLGVNDHDNEHMSGNFNPEILNCGYPIRLSQWPVPPEPYYCSCCQVLREIIHIIDGETRKFEIHGRLGMIFHGILELCRTDMTTPYKEYQMFDFCKETIPYVKGFLVQYCEQLTDAGFTLVKDPLLTFYDALSIGSDWDFGLDIDEILNPTRHIAGENIWQQPEATNQPSGSQPQTQCRETRSKTKRSGVRSKRTRTYKEQRDFIKDLRVKDLVRYFHLSQIDVAEEVGISFTAIKDVCKREKFSWPHKKVKNLREAIEKRRKDLNAADDQIRALAESDIRSLSER